MQFTLTAQDGGIACVSGEGDLSQSPQPASLDKALEALLGADCYRRPVLLDLEKARFIDSSGVGWLMTSHKRFRTDGGRLVLHSVPPMVAQVLRLLNLHTVLSIQPDQAAARALVADAKEH